ncbi:Peptidase M3A/M3B [Cordyceps fumosorosea ARSEF 2679]|uniref:Peptidase M3A/M3B n=1 Tax=Cordyceps fumosorosea (strain ARSEF 2679) TaxID=1081104 RepID=A0A167LY89_CORFA|nr:Peptidase M3A/M3B [Cordyceps fumosorosea ARSEF 2679]OAA53672.1 Peptidase M3A/M3B [Cordyceps fumosorosea ARSEF 2679]
MTTLPQLLLRIPATNDLVGIQQRLVAGRQDVIETIMATVSLEEATFDNVYAPVLRYDDAMLNDRCDNAQRDEISAPAIGAGGRGRLGRGFLRQDGSRQYPAAILMCSFSLDVVDGCTVLTHANVKTMYHELGHALHALLSRTKWGDSHGYRACLEFVEAIGTCIENYAWLRKELKRISCHYIYTDDEYQQAWMERHPGEALPPRELPAELYLKQLVNWSFDMAVHNPKTHQDLEALDETRLYQDLEAQSTFTLADRSSYPQAAFSQFVSGYQSGYFAYIWYGITTEILR